MHCTPPLPVFKILVEIEALLESVYTSAGIDQLLLTREVRVALGADFNADVLLCRAGVDDITACTGNGGLLVFGMQSFLHSSHLFR